MSNKMKTAIFIGGFTVFTLGALYPVVVYPKLHPEVFSEYIITGSPSSFGDRQRDIT